MILKKKTLKETLKPHKPLPTMGLQELSHLRLPNGPRLPHLALPQRLELPHLRLPKPARLPHPRLPRLPHLRLPRKRDGFSTACGKPARRDLRILAYRSLDRTAGTSDFRIFDYRRGPNAGFHGDFRIFAYRTPRCFAPSLTEARELPHLRLP